MPLFRAVTFLAISGYPPPPFAVSLVRRQPCAFP
jgi:hypothetical protein